MKTIVRVEMRDHISAGELRGLGFDIQPDIPDDWIIPRGSLMPDPDSVKVEVEGDTLHCSFECRPSEGFRPPMEFEIDAPADAVLDAFNGGDE